MSGLADFAKIPPMGKKSTKGMPMMGKKSMTSPTKNKMLTAIPKTMKVFKKKKGY